MSNNPYSEAIGRVFLMVIGVLGAVACVAVVASSFSSGAAPRIGSRSLVLPNPYTLANSPSQFWFGVIFYVLAGAVFGWSAWRAYRG